CGSSPVIKRFPRTESGGVAGRGKEVMRLPQGIDFAWSSAYADPRGRAVVMHTRSRCGNAWASDVYRFSDTAALDVTADGSGGGTVRGPGIDCGEDCADVVSGGEWVTLTAEPELTSHFAGWSVPCARSDPEENSCVFRVDEAQTVTATFDLGPLP
ncbi:MAG: hypothetical protein M3275_12075, partial [Thermoproteota archaeon]|nr:hypothetical protein [Thermoproteota archaeon]